MEKYTIHINAAVTVIRKHVLVNTDRDIFLHNEYLNVM